MGVICLWESYRAAEEAGCGAPRLNKPSYFLGWGPATEVAPPTACPVLIKLPVSCLPPGEHNSKWRPLLPWEQAIVSSSKSPPHSRGSHL